MQTELMLQIRCEIGLGNVYGSLDTLLELLFQWYSKETRDLEIGDSNKLTVPCLEIEKESRQICRGGYVELHMHP